MSQRQLLSSGAAKRADALRIRYDQIFVEPGFNVPETPAEFAERVDGIVQFLMTGKGSLPPIEVRVRDEGGVYLVDGHARHAAYAIALEKGAPLADPKDGVLYMAMTYFIGNNADRVLRTITSARSRKEHTPFQLSCQYMKLHVYGWSPADIAHNVSRSVEHVRQMLALAEADVALQNKVKAKEISTTEAVKLLKQYGERAASVVEEKLVEAKAAGKKKVTAAIVNSEKRAEKQRRESEGLADVELLNWLAANASIRFNRSVGMLEISVQAPACVEAQQDVRLALRAAMAKATADREPMNSLFAVPKATDEREAA